METGGERDVTTATRATTADPWLDLESALFALARSGGPLRAAIALADGELPWTKVRALARLASAEEMEAWLPLAAKHTAASLDREVRRVAHCAESLADEDHEPREPIVLSVTPRVRGKWHYAASLARKTAGFHASPAAVAEMLAVEVLSALEPDESFRTDDPEDARLAIRAAAIEPSSSGPAEPVPGSAAVPELPGAPGGEPGPGSAALERLVDGLDQADARELDRRLRDWIAREQRLDAEIGARLAPIARRHLYRALGFASLDAYARERLGIDPAKARALLRVERAAAQAPELAAPYRSGALSWVTALALVPVILADSLGRFAASWVVRAREVTVRQLRDDMERALLVFEADPELWSRTGGLPERLDLEAGRPNGREIGALEGDRVGVAGVDMATADREIGAHERSPGDVAQGMVAGPTRFGLEIGARVRASDGCEGVVQPDGWIRLDTGGFVDPIVWKLLEEPDTPDEGGAPHDESTCPETATLRFLAMVSVARLFRAVHACVQRGLARVTGRPVTPSEALEAMLDHAIVAWERRYSASHRLFDYHRSRCAVPGCSSRRNLHDHHIVFRSAGGDDSPANRVPLCAFHHLRGVHQRLIRITGEAPHRLHFELPLETFVSGDRRYSSHAEVSG